jgi:hypothetical protein
MSTKSEQGLMSKKKAELIDIILRKDDVERELRKELDATKLDFEKAKKMVDNNETTIKDLRKENEELEKSVNAHQDTIDDAVFTIAEHKHTIGVYKGLTIFFAITTIVATVLIFVF